MIAIFIKLWPLITCTALYVLQVFILLLRKDFAAAITFAGYALANVGLIWSLS